MSKVAIIGLSGRKRSGKDTVFDLITKHCKCTVMRFAFADALKEELAEACGVSVDDINNNKEAYRLGLQWWGTEFRRNLFGRDYWTDKVGHRLDKFSVFIKEFDLDCGVAVVTDCRFLNEAHLVRGRHGILARVDRPLADKDAHPSETSMDDYQFDYVIKNHGTLEDLSREVLGMLRDINDRGTRIAGIQ